MFFKKKKNEKLKKDYKFRLLFAIKSLSNNDLRYIRQVVTEEMRRRNV